VTKSQLRYAVRAEADIEGILSYTVERTGAGSKLLSFYVRDPDGNLMENAQPAG
jgi:hypothetical protein